MVVKRDKWMTVEDFLALDQEAEQEGGLGLGR
jgi:hypothetical protein